ncbi:hypothetical protein HOLleu_03492 [Holothuria leucospilota]|uniref:Uncharacterized protein n=1 Tax=Holothuria leucospilota TaxID=206669 RepID=A0A9Q1CSX1_HOLLE|nr:hypothetical protein HOLleu_03492 [Holothuria leucospilota]
MMTMVATMMRQKKALLEEIVKPDSDRAKIATLQPDSLAVGKRANKLKAAVSLVDVTFTPESHLKEAARLVVVDRKERVIPHLPTDLLNSKSELNGTDR